MKIYGILCDNTTNNDSNINDNSLLETLCIEKTQSENVICLGDCEKIKNVILKLCENGNIKYNLKYHIFDIHLQNDESQQIINSDNDTDNNNNSNDTMNDQSNINSIDKSSLPENFKIKFYGATSIYQSPHIA